MSDTPRTDHYRKEFARRKDYSDIVRWLLDEFEQTEKRLHQAEGEIQRFTNVYMQEINAELQALANDVADLSRTISTDNDGAFWGDSPDDHLGNIAGYIGRIEALHDNQHDKLFGALASALEVIKQWHNMGGAESVWQIYYDNAPEMKPIRDALK